MKNLLKLMLLALVLVTPFNVFAADEEESEDKINVYVFYGSTCPHCEELFEWFETVDEEYTSKYNLIKYEVWENDNNAELMSSVGEAFNEEVSGVPYIIIGENTMSGFSSDSADTILGYISDEYDKNPEDRVDVVQEVIESTGWKSDGSESTDEKTEKNESKSTELIIGIAFIAVVVGVVFLIVKAREE